ncbi:unnamed protein product [Cuscuta campestris]|uniref:Knottin scorpion toxin-like domain-containing protein n=1 Tax=Cuscuta campestris TaxID=132261 RepID=A0A484MKH7_9ASTE|nr:unnamed protein product [Cuscuta campestris]
MAKFNMLFILLGAMLILSSTDVILAQDNKSPCCKENHIGSCVPGTSDDSKCKNFCIGNQCDGGICKVIGNKPPNHFCHCSC